MEISSGVSPTADKLVVSGQPLTYAGTLVVTNIGTGEPAAGDSFVLFSASSFSGNFAATNLPPLSGNKRWVWSPGHGLLFVTSTAPTNLLFSVAGGQLTLNWAADHTGWTLQMQTNSLIPGGWRDVANSTTTNQMTFPIDSTYPATFYRLKLPGE
ncbi:MAG: hypothetical protein U1F98_01625 [Verrucomicrobiota bacterium]